MSTKQQMFFRRYQAARRQQLVLPNAIRMLLHEADIEPGQLDGCAVGCGPGSFTGIRIGIALIQAIAWVNGLTVMPLSSLAGIASVVTNATECTEGSPVVGAERVLAAIDARRGEVHWACYDCTEGVPKPLAGEYLTSVDAVAIPEVWRDGKGWVAVGDGADKIVWDALGCYPVAISTAARPDAAGMLAMARARWESGSAPGERAGLAPAEIGARYGRGADAWRRSGTPLPGA